MKYIIAATKTDGTRHAYPFLFSRKINHDDDAAKRFKHLVIFDSPYDDVSVLSAGRARFDGGWIMCTPGSITLGINDEVEMSPKGSRDAIIFASSQSDAAHVTVSESGAVTRTFTTG